MSGLLGACMVAVAAYCCVRFAQPLLRVPGHGRELEGWHLLMVVTMAAMLVAPPGWHRLGVVGLYAAAVFAVGIGRALWEAARRHLGAAHLRLAVGAAAMLAMLLPLAPAEAASPATGHVHGQPMSMLPGNLAVLLLVALGLVLAVALRRLLRRTTPGAARADAVCEALMTLAMAWMVLRES